MRNSTKDDEEENSEKEPIIIERGDGLGWTLNFYRPVSYVILIAMLVVIVGLILLMSGAIKI